VKRLVLLSTAALVLIAIRSSNAYGPGAYPYFGDLPFAAYLDEIGDAAFVTLPLAASIAPPPPHWWSAPTIRRVARRTAEARIQLSQFEFAFTTELSDDGFAVPICR
jgi:hypothetical protein